MSKNRFLQLLSGFNKIKEKIKENIPFLNIKKNTQEQVSGILNIEIPAANDTIFTPETQSKIDSVSNETDNIINTHQEPINILGDFSGYKKFKFRKQGYKLQFQDGVIINAYKIKNGVNIPVKATTIRQISALLKKSSNEVNKITYSTKRNSQNTFNTKLHGQYTYTNESKTQFIIIVNKGKIIKSIYKNTKTTPSQEEIQIIQSSINKSTLGLSGYKSARVLKKEIDKARKQKESILEVTHKTVKKEVEKPNFNGSDKHIKSQKFKYKQELINETERQEKRSENLQNEIRNNTQNIADDYKKLYSETFNLSKIGSWNNKDSKVTPINNNERSKQVKSALFIYKTFLKRIPSSRIDRKTNISPVKRMIYLRDEIKEYINKNTGNDKKIQDYKLHLNNLVTLACDMLIDNITIPKYQTKKSKKTSHKKETPSSHKHNVNKNEDAIKGAKIDWVKRYYPNEEAA